MPHTSKTWRKPQPKHNDTMRGDDMIAQVILPQFSVKFRKPLTMAEVIQMMQIKNWHLKHSSSASDPRDRKRHGDIHDQLAGVIQYSMKQLEHTDADYGKD